MLRVVELNVQIQSVIIGSVIKKENVMKLKISRGLTINTGNFQSIKPEVSIEVDVGGSNFEQTHQDLKDLVDNLFMIEVATLYAEQNSISNKIKKYVDSVFKNSDTIDKDIKKLTSRLLSSETPF